MLTVPTTLKDVTVMYRRVSAALLSYRKHISRQHNRAMIRRGLELESGSQEIELGVYRESVGGIEVGQGSDSVADRRAE